VTPDAYVKAIGADAMRAYLMFIGPWEQGGEWDDSGLSGISRWLNRVWNLVLGVCGEGVSRPQPDERATKELRRITHKTIKKVAEDLERFRFNTMIAALMEFTNYLTRAKEARSVDSAALWEAIDALLLMLAPSIPHLSEELWALTGHPYSIHNQPFPSWDGGLVVDEEITLVIQVNGRLRDRVAVPASITEAEARRLALGRERVQTHLGGREPTQIIYVPGRLVNVVVR